MCSFVAYLDILGTSSKVINEQFDDALMLDFSNAVMVTAINHQDCRFSVFSDCVIVSCPSEKPKVFFEVIEHMYREWCSDAIFVRGGIALGELNWVDFPLDKKVFNQVKNLAHSRVYGKALVEAHKLEISSGPGAVPFVSDKAAKRLEADIPNSICRGQSNVLRFLSLEQIKIFQELCRGFVKGNADWEVKRHYVATIRIIDAMLTE